MSSAIKLKQSLTQLLVILAGICLTSIPLTAVGTTTHVEGVLSYFQTDSATGELQKGLECGFSVFVRSNLWMVRTESPTGKVMAKAPNLLANECWFDGGAYYEVTRSKTNTTVPNPQNIKNLRTIRVLVSVYEKQQCPTFSSTMCFPPWLAYASTLYLQEHSGLLPNIILLVGYPANDQFRYISVSSTFHSNEIGTIPEVLTFSNTGWEVANTFGQKAELIKLPPPFDRGFLAGSYRVDTWKQDSEGEFPERSELVLYFPPRTKTTASDDSVNAKPNMRMDLFAKSVQIEDDSFEFRPNLTGPLTQVTDHRVQFNGAALSYASDKGIVASNDPQYSKLVKGFTYDENVKRANQRVNTNGTLYQSALVIVLALPLLYLWNRSRRALKTK